MKRRRRRLLAQDRLELGPKQTRLQRIRQAAAGSEYAHVRAVCVEVTGLAGEAREKVDALDVHRPRREAVGCVEVPVADRQMAPRQDHLHLAARCRPDLVSHERDVVRI